MSEPSKLGVTYTGRPRTIGELLGLLDKFDDRFSLDVFQVRADLRGILYGTDTEPGLVVRVKHAAWADVDEYRWARDKDQPDYEGALRSEIGLDHTLMDFTEGATSEEGSEG